VRAAWLAVLTASLLAGPAVPGVAGIDDTQRRKAQADARARQAAQRVDDLSAQLHAAVRALAAVRDRVPAARVRLARVRGTLAAARARDAELGAQLAVTRAAQQRTRAEVGVARGRMRESRRLIGRIARTAYQDGALSEWSTVLGAQTLREMAGRLATLRSTSQAEDALLKDLGGARADLAASRASLRARAELEARLKAAQAALVWRIEGLEAEALAAATRLPEWARARAAAAARVRSERSAERARFVSAVAESKALARRIAAQRRAAERRLAAQRRREAARRAAEGHAPAPGGGGGGAGPLLWPVPGPISTYAGPRINPVTGARSCHSGIDVAAGYASAIRAMASGVVVATTVNAWDGLTTVIAHGGGMTTWYAHQSRFAVRQGQPVSRGEIIGYVGSSGFSTGAHLHFNVAINEVAYDPMGWFGGPRRTVASLCPGGPAPVL
jgi:murein DD-endopeptidase MepM/ murein hydrolase activator NlpD